MGQFEATTKSAKQIWKSSDGQRTIWEVVLDVNGKMAKAKTYSASIAKTGFSGAVESYDKDGRNGPETFVKQVPKEGGFHGGKGKDEGAIQAMWSISQAIAWLSSTQGSQASFEDIRACASDLFNMVTDVKGGEAPAPEEKPLSEFEDLNNIFGEE